MSLFLRHLIIIADDDLKISDGFVFTRRASGSRRGQTRIPPPPCNIELYILYCRGRLPSDPSSAEGFRFILKYNTTIAGFSL